MRPTPLADALLDACERFSDRPALWVEGETLSYQQLFEQALAIASGLAALGLAPSERVAILSRRSSRAYAGVLGTILAGGAYVPMNTRYPAERNQAILRASGARALILDEPCASDLDSVLGDLPAWVTPIAPHAIADAGSVVCAPGETEPYQGGERLAYILFTSGTTGTPKGVPITHANLAAYLDAIADRFGIGPEDRVLQAADLTFDQSVHDLFFTWINGAALYSLPENAAILAPRLIARHGITACQLVPSTATQAAQRGLLKPGAMPSLRVSLFGGEALPASVMRVWAEAAPNTRIINVYGPTEGTVTFSTFEFDPRQPLDYSVLPIGLPLKGEEMIVCDDNGVELAEGETGEIWLSGPQMTPGYWRAPELDAAKFVEIAGKRWYRTGDVGRRVEPHGLIFAGRADRQVKIRGYRVELQEIEGALRRACGRDAVAVIAWPMSGEGSADGCIAFIDGPEIDEEAVLARCGQMLPAYMTPARILRLDALPLNPNGKVDYRRLPSHIPADL